jgi:hypothetical protein
VSTPLGQRAPVIWVSRGRILDARRIVICTSAHIGRSLVHTLTGGKYCQKIKFWLRNNSDKPGLSNEASGAANERRPVTVKDGKVSSGSRERPGAEFDKDA